MQRDVRGILSRLPKTLDETYERVLRAIHDDNKEHARRLLHCLAVAVRPLRVEELAEILAFDFDAAKGDIPEYHAEWRWKDQEEAVLSTCSSLITIAEYNGSNGSTRVVQFSHFTVKEFLMADRLATPTRDVSEYHILLEPAHTIIAQACLGFLLHMRGCIVTETAKDFPLAKYAAEHWVAHAQFQDVASHLKHGMKEFFDPEKPYFASWIGTHDKNVPAFDQHTRPTPLYYSALYGFHEPAKHLAIKYPQLANAIGGRYDFPLLAALSQGHVEVAEVLAEHGSDVNAHGTRGRTQLHTLLSRSYLDGNYSRSVRFLLEHGVDPNSKSKDGEAPLHIVLFNYLHGYRSTNDVLQVAQLLLEHGADPNSKSEDDEAPLHILLFNYPRRYRSTNDILPVAQLLLEHGADPNTKSKDGEAPLHILSLNRLRRYRSTNDVLQVAQLLLEHGADPSSKSKDGEAPLHILLFNHLRRYRSANDVLPVAQLFLVHGADPNSKSEDGEAPLHILLFNYLRDRYRSTDDVLRVTQLLLEGSADPNLKGKDGDTPLQILLRGCHRFLSGRSNFNGNDILLAVKLLLEHGTDVNPRHKGRETPLRLALRYEASNGADPDSEHEEGKTPLHKLLGPQHCGFCSYYYRPDRILVVVQALLEHGADVNAQDNDHKTPLFLAMRYRTPDIVRCLLEHGANPNLGNHEGKTPLHLLLGLQDFDEDFGYHSDDHIFVVAQLLLEHGADANSQDKSHETPLLLALRRKAPNIARFLLKHGADPSVGNSEGATSCALLECDNDNDDVPICSKY